MNPNQKRIKNAFLSPSINYLKEISKAFKALRIYSDYVLAIIELSSLNKMIFC